MSNVKSSDFMHFEAMSLFETLPPTKLHPYRIPFVITFKGSKIPGVTEGVLLGVDKNNVTYEIAGGKARYDGGPNHHWTAGVLDVDLIRFKEIVAEAAERYFVP